MSTHEPPAMGETVAALAGGLTRITRRVDQLGEQVGALGEAVAALAPGGTPTPITPSLAQQPPAAVVDLLDWLRDVYLAYDGATLGPCWAWHPGVVEELTVLRGMHRLIYDAADWLRAGDWHDRYRPGVVRRIGQALAGCDITRHANDQYPTVPLAGALEPIAAARAQRTPVPAPTAAQTAAARALSSRTRATP